MMKAIASQRGASVLEVILALGIIFLALTGTLSLFKAGFRSLASSDRMTVALNSARSKLEEIKGTEFSQITTLYPDGSIYTLPSINGAIRVEYPNGTSSDPLIVKVTVTWPEGDVQRSITLVTMVSSR